MRRARGLDVLHCTTFRGPVGFSVPTDVTVHDLAILRAPEAFPRWHRLYGRAGLERVLQAADAIIAVSEFSRREVTALADVPAERVRVVPNGVDVLFTPDGPRADGDYVRIHTAGKSHLVRDTMAAMEQRFDATQFVRIHRSAIVNVARIRELRPYSSREYAVILNDGTRLRLSRRYRNRLQGRFGDRL